MPKLKDLQKIFILGKHLKNLSIVTVLNVTTYFYQGVSILTNSTIELKSKFSWPLIPQILDLHLLRQVKDV
jgi:hypothetical protein